MRNLIDKVDDLPVATILIVILALVGGVVTIVNPDALSFDQYVAYVGGSGAALGIGRGIAANGKSKSLNVGSVGTIVNRNETTDLPVELQPGEGDPLPPVADGRGTQLP